MTDAPDPRTTIGDGSFPRFLSPGMTVVAILVLLFGLYLLFAG